MTSEQTVRQLAGLGHTSTYSNSDWEEVMVGINTDLAADLADAEAGTLSQPRIMYDPTREEYTASIRELHTYLLRAYARHWNSQTAALASLLPLLLSPVKYDKLIAMRSKNAMLPSVAFVTIDDEMFFHPELIRRLVLMDNEGRAIADFAGHEVVHAVAQHPLRMKQLLHNRQRSVGWRIVAQLNNTILDMNVDSNAGRLGEHHANTVLASNLGGAADMLDAHAEEKGPADGVPAARVAAAAQRVRVLLTDKQGWVRVWTSAQAVEDKMAEVADAIDDLCELLREDGEGAGGGVAAAAAAAAAADMEGVVAESFDANGDVRELSEAEIAAIDSGQASKRLAALTMDLEVTNRAGLGSRMDALRLQLRAPTLSLRARVAQTLSRGRDRCQYPQTDIAMGYHSVILPGRVGQTSKAVLVLDTSGSVVCVPDRLTALASEVVGGLDAKRVGAVRLILCDGEITYDSGGYNVPVGALAQRLSKEIKGGGGTSFNPPFQRLMDEQDKPDLVVYFTDTFGEVDARFGNVFRDTVWVSTQGGNVMPFGKTHFVQQESKR